MPSRSRKQPVSKTPESGDRLSLRDAAQVMGVHPATLRAWADRGQIASQRTAGGHRRFLRAELHAWLDARRSGDAGAQALVHNALGRMRIGMEQADAPWPARLDEPARRAHRDIGRRLLQEIARAVSMPEFNDPSRAAAERIGQEYAALTRQQSFSLSEAVRAFLFFRDTIVDALVQMASALEPIAAPSWLTVHRQLSAFLNAVLLALVRAYESGERGE
jgi:excisionase family DNA binding protein